MKKKPTQERVNIYLDDLRESGITNMYGAGSYIQDTFGLDMKTAHAMLAEWMRTFAERHPVQVKP